MTERSSHRIPFIDLTPSACSIWQKIGGEIEDSFLNADFIAGTAVRELENDLGVACAVNEVVACANGTDALMLALRALEIGPGHRVAIPNLTFWATYEAVVQVGATPVLIDVEPDHLQINIEELARAHRAEPLSACIVVHLFGWCHPDLLELRAMCRKFGISLVEDGAQAFGVELVGSSGGFESVFHGAEIATLSFYPAKVLGGCMDGGAVLTSSAELAKTVRSLLNHGRKGHYSYEHVGWNSRMASVQGLYLRQALHHAPQWLEQRREILRVYHDTLTAKGVMVRVPPATIRGNGYLAVAQLPTGLPFVVQKKLEERGIGTGRVYPETIHQQLPARHASRGSELSVSSDFVTQVINLPLFPGLSPSAQNEVIVNFLEAL